MGRDLPISKRCRAALLAALPAALLGALLGTTPAYAAPARYELDPEHTSLAFLVSHVGFADVLGFFGDVEGSFQFDEATGELSDLTVVVQTESVFTNHDERDEHLRSDEFLDTSSHSEMTFTASGARRTAERVFEVDGQLELLGRTAPLTLTATWNKSDDSPFGDAYVIGVSARGSFERSAFGMSYGVENGWVGDDVEIVVEFEAQRQRL